MRFGPISIERIRRVKGTNRYVLPWEILTTEDLSPEVRRVIAKVARGVAKDFMTEELAALQTQIDETRAQLAELSVPTEEHNPGNTEREAQTLP